MIGQLTLEEPVLTPEEKCSVRGKENTQQALFVLKQDLKLYITLTKNRKKDLTCLTNSLQIIRHTSIFK